MAYHVHSSLPAGRRALRGQAALSTIFLIGGIIVLFGISLALIALSLMNSSLGFQASNRALAAASGGLRDAELQLIRNKDFTDAGYCVPAASTPCPDGYAKVIVVQNSPSAGSVTVTSEATANHRKRRLQAIYAVSSTSTEVIPVSSTILTQ